MFLKISQSLQGNTCAKTSFLIKFQASSLQLYFKKKVLHRCFSVNCSNFLLAPTAWNICKRLLPYKSTILNEGSLPIPIKLSNIWTMHNNKTVLKGKSAILNVYKKTHKHYKTTKRMPIKKEWLYFLTSTKCPTLLNIWPFPSVFYFHVWSNACKYD